MAAGVLCVYRLTPRDDKLQIFFRHVLFTQGFGSFSYVCVGELYIGMKSGSVINCCFYCINRLLVSNTFWHKTGRTINKPLLVLQIIK